MPWYLKATNATRCRARIRALASISTPTDVESKALGSGRSKLRRDIVNWRKSQFSKYPKLQELISSVDYDKPEAEVLLLPSGLPEHRRNELGLKRLASTEYRLRTGQAHSALEKVR